MKVKFMNSEKVKKRLNRAYLPRITFSKIYKIFIECPINLKTLNYLTRYPLINNSKIN